MKKILVTCAFPYANGSIHVGHMLEHIQADIWVRFQRMIGNKVYFICSDDAHGAPIMLKSQQLKVYPEEMINKIFNEHKKDFFDFNISYDNYYSTHSKENYELLILIFNRLKKNGLILVNNVLQFFDCKKNMFLPDRFVKGTCPKCNALNQYGDHCENCGAVYCATELINPISTISSSKPILKKSKHYFFNLPYFKDKLKFWIKSNILQKSVYNKVKSWLLSDLKPYDISRDNPYFGFKIPNSSNKYFYVWLDAIIGYMATFKNLCNKKNNIDFDEFWKENSKTSLYHFLGKDIIYFHSLLWPAILEGSNFRKPTKLFVHGYVTINGKKMSKSQGTLVEARTYLNFFNSDSLRYYYATKLSSNIDDININYKNIVQRVNIDIVNKLVNLASRNASFINKYFNNKLSSKLDYTEIYSTFIESHKHIKELYNDRKFSHVTNKVMHLADLANLYINNQAPWKILKKQGCSKKLLSICSMGIELFRILIIYLKPILPDLTIKTEEFLNTSLKWNNINKPLLSHVINDFKPLFYRLDEKKINKILNI